MDKLIIWFLKKYSVNRKRLLIYAIIFSLIQSALLLPSLYFIKQIFDSNLPQKNLKSLLVNSLIILAITIAQSLLSIVHRNILLKTVKNVILQLQNDILKTLIVASKKFYDSVNVAEISNNTVHDVENIDKMFDGILSVVIPQCCLFITGVIIMLLYNPVIGILTIGLGISGIIAQKKIRKSIFDLIRNYAHAKDQLSSYVNFMPQKHILIKLKNFEKKELESVVSIGNQKIELGIKTAKLGWKIKITDDLIINISATLLLVFGSIQILYEQTTYGNIFGLYFLIVFMRRTISAIQSQWTTIQEGLVSLERIKKIFSVNFQEDKTYAGNIKIVFDGNIKAEEVSFQYDNKPILKCANFAIKKGEIVTISGMNGSGKSSLINLILGFYSPYSGDIYAEKHSYSDINLGELRTQIGYVPQNQVLLDGTIGSNLTYGLEFDAITLKNKLDSPLFHELLVGFDAGLQTKIITGGKNLSNGQIQRISIIRALISDPKLLILDEPTNHLDDASVLSLLTEIRKRQEISILIVSHHEMFKEVSDRNYHLSNCKLSEVKYFFSN